MISEGYRKHGGVKGSMKFKKTGFFFRKMVLPEFWGPWLRSNTLIDLANTALASKGSVKTKCMIREGYRTHRGVAGPKSFKERGGFFFGKSCSRVFGAPGCHASTLIDFANTALASKSSVKPICMISEGYRTHGAVTGPMKFKKNDVSFFFFVKSCSRDFGAPACHPSTLIDFVNIALASKGSAETICMIWEGCRTHRAVTGPINFKKSAFFFGKSCSWKFGAPGCHPSTLIDLANTALASRGLVKLICMISKG